jgi:hypothetical protein
VFHWKVEKKQIFKLRLKSCREKKINEKNIFKFETDNKPNLGEIVIAINICFFFYFEFHIKITFKFNIIEKFFLHKINFYSCFFFSISKWLSVLEFFFTKTSYVNLLDWILFTHVMRTQNHI